MKRSFRENVSQKKVEAPILHLIFYQFDKLIHEGVVRANVASRPERPQDVDGLPAQRDHHEGHGGRAGPGNAHLTVDQNLPASGLKCWGDELVGAAQVRQDLGAGVVPQR